MKRLDLSSLLLLSILFLDCSSPWERVPFSVVPDHPSVGERVTIRYIPRLSGPSLAAAGRVSLRFTLLDKEGAPFSDALPMNRKGDGWEISFLPASPTRAEPVLLVCAFIDGDDPEREDNNRDESWIAPFFQDGRPVEGASYQEYRAG